MNKKNEVKKHKDESINRMMAYQKTLKKMLLTKKSGNRQPRRG